MKKQVLTILGATGTIGVNTLDVLARHPEPFEVFALTGATQVDKLYQQCLQFRPRYAVMTEADHARALREKLTAAGSSTDVLAGGPALIEVAAAPEVTTLMAAIVGAAGLPGTGLDSFLEGAKLRQPTLFIAGDADPVIRMYRKPVESLEMNVPDLKGKVIIPGPGHWVNQERPEEVNRLLLQFLKSLSPHPSSPQPEVACWEKGGRSC